MHPSSTLRGLPASFRSRIRHLEPARRALRVGAVTLEETRRAAVNRALTKRHGQDRDVVIGPWVSELGFEILYWIPLLNWLRDRGAFAPERTTVISRGGPPWYTRIAHGYADIFDVLTPTELRDLNEQRVDQTGGQKHMGVTEIDEEIVRRLAPKLPADASFLHPSVMYNAFRYFWSWREPPKAVTRHLRFEPLPDPGPDPVLEAKLPESYVAVKAYFSSCFPPTDENKRFLVGLLQRLAARTDVVLLSTGLNIDDHAEFRAESGGRIIDAQPWMTARDNLATQTRIIRGAEALVSSYGGFSYLGPFLDVPSICFYSHANFNPTHLELMRHAEAALNTTRFAAFDVRDVALADCVARASAEMLARGA